mmetsp:Transcript_1513/g.5035  ORF Transcript_1513/g.5035 Transcript_1513/m.5035 type:complete len:293 (-) Transcript_1513:1567-2445(-)
MLMIRQRHVHASRRPTSDVRPATRPWSSVGFIESERSFSSSARVCDFAHTISASTDSAASSSSSFFFVSSFFFFVSGTNPPDASAVLLSPTASPMSAKIFAAKSAGCSIVNPDVSIAVSKRSSAVVAALASPASCFFFRSRITALVGLISIVFLPFMYSLARESPIACAFMMRSMFADQPNLDVTRMHGVPASRFETITFSTLSPSEVFIHAVNAAYSSSISLIFAFSSSLSSPRSKSSLEMSTSVFSLNDARFVIVTSSIGSIRNKTSKPFFVSCSKNGEFSAASRVSAAT